MGYYYHDPTGLGIWYVPDNQTPAQAFSDIQQATGATFSPLLTYSIANTPDAQRVGGGSPGAQPQTTPKITSPQAAKITAKAIIISRPGDSLPVDDNGNCPDGYAVDITGQMCIPVGTEQPQPGPTATTDSQQVNVNLTVNNAVGLSTGVGQAIGDAVNNDVQSAIDATDNAIQGVSSDIQATVDDTTSKVGSLVDSIVNGVKSALNWVWNLIITQIGNVLSIIKSGIGDLVSAVSDAINNVIIPVARDIQQVIGEVNNVLNNTIAPIFQTIQQVYQQTSAAITAIENDLKNGITGILQLPTDVSNSLSSVEASLQRLSDTVFTTKQGQSSVFLGPDGNDSVWTRLQGIGSNITSVTGHDQQNTTFTDHVKLPEPTITQAGSATFDAVFAEIKDFVLSLMHGGQSSIDAVKSATSLIPFLLGSVAELPASIVLIAGGFVAGMLPLFEFLSGDIRAKAGLEKLQPAEALEAALRGFIDAPTLATELAFRGYDAQRIQILTDLQKYLISNDQILDLWFRGIVSDVDRDANLNAHGVTESDSKALIEGAYRLVEVNLARTARRWSIIDDTAFDAVLKQNRYTDNEIALEHSTLFTREGVDDVIARERREILYSGLGYSPEGYSTPSADALTAASRDGIDAATALDRWQSSYFVLPLSEWIESYFRNLVTLGQLNAAMDYYRVPSQQRDLLINSHRALIPWRTIPTMVANGILDNPTAAGILQQHGFDLPSTEALLKYAELTKPKSKAVPPPDVIGLSLATARGYFDNGTIDAAQYKEVLLAHGYDDQTAALQVQVETQHAAMLARKQLAADIVAEVKAGVLTTDQAVTAMESASFSVAEKSNVLNKINGVKRQTVKRPSEAELHDMVKSGAISIDLYSSTMLADGWSQSWVTNFVNWRFPNAASSTSAA